MMTTSAGTRTTTTPRILLPLLVAVLGLCPIDVPAQAAPSATPLIAPQRLRYEVTADGVVIVIRASQDAPVTVHQDRQDLLLSFADAVPKFDAEELQRRAAPWIESISVGYDSVLLRLVGSAMYAHVVSTADFLELKLDALPDAAADAQDKTRGEPPPPATSTGTKRLELLRAQLLLRNKDLMAARESFESLRIVMPDQAEPLVGLAEVESAVGRWRRSAALYREAATLGGDTPELMAAHDEIARSQGDRVSLGIEERKSHGGIFDAQVTLTLNEVKGVHRINEAWRLNLDADLARVRTDSVRRDSGALEPFSGQRSRAALSAQHDAISGAVTVGTLFLGSGTAGLGLLRRQPDDTGMTSLSVEAWRPNWDYVEGLINDALRDRLAIGRTQRLQPDLSGRVEFGVNRYHRQEDGELGRSNSLAAELRLNRLAGIPGLTAAYSIDGEYINSTSARLSATGETFSLLPLVDREVHSLSLGYTRSSGNRWTGSALTFDGYAGVGHDRFGGSGEFAAVFFSYARGAFEIRLWGSQVRNIGRSRGISDAVGLLLLIQL